MTPRERLNAWLLPLGAPLLAFTTGLQDGGGPPWPWLSLGGAALVAGGGAVVHARDREGRALVAAGVALSAVAIARPLLASPVLAFLVLAAVATFLVRFRDADGAGEDGAGEDAATPDDGDRARFECFTAAVAALGCWFFVVAGRAGAPPWGAVAVAAALAVAMIRSARWTWRRSRAWRAATAGIAGLALAGAAVALAAHHPRWAATCLAIPVAFVLVTSPPRREEARRWLPDLDHPVNLLVVTFAFLSALGGLLLMLPVCSATGRAIDPLSALFTSTSAVCVTGLIVLDTPVAFGTTGQVVLLLLIQVGGLGIMTFSTAALGMLGRRLSMRHEGAMAGLVGGDNRRDLFRILRETLLLTALFEIAGAALLATLFRMGGEGAASAAWRGLFTSVSAFCNAGFALQSDNLVGFRKDPLVLHTVALLIIAGGLSPAVLAALPGLLRGGRTALRVKLALAASGVLLALGFVVFAAFEWHGPAFADLPPADRLHNAWFQSVTTRTAGFNSVDLSQFGDASLTWMMFLMFVGGSPGSTAGGIKTTTFAVIVLGVLAGLRGRREPEVFGRRISAETFHRATSIAVLGSLAVFTAVVALLATSGIPYRAALFEVISALGTVGLSIGATPLLDATGKVIVIVCMLAGRVGPLSAFVFFLDRHPAGAWEFPAEDVEVG